MFIMVGGSPLGRLLGVGVLLIIGFIICGIFAWSELEYSVWGRVASAIIVDTTPEPMIAHNAVTVRYSFQNGSTARDEKYTFDEGWEQPAGGQVDVIYMPGLATWSKPITARRWWAVAIFCVGAAALAAFVALFTIKVYRELAPMLAEEKARKAAAK